MKYAVSEINLNIIEISWNVFRWSNVLKGLLCDGNIIVKRVGTEIFIEFWCGSFFENLHLE